MNMAYSSEAFFVLHCLVLQSYRGRLLQTDPVTTQAIWTKLFLFTAKTRYYFYCFVAKSWATKSINNGIHCQTDESKQSRDQLVACYPFFSRIRIMKSLVSLRRDFKSAVFVALFSSALNHT